MTIESRREPGGYHRKFGTLADYLRTGKIRWSGERGQLETRMHPPPPFSTGKRMRIGGKIPMN
jgi:hypothetical protein